MKKILATALSLALMLSLAAACGADAPSEPIGSDNNSPPLADSPSPDQQQPDPPPPPEPAPSNESNFDASQFINVVSREDGSGTRGAFIEIFGVLHDGIDRTTQEAHIADGTNLVLTTVAGDLYSIGYVSMGALNDTIKALSVDGVAPTTDNINNGTYTVMRPFNIAYKELNEVAQDFYNFIFSADGQAIVDDRGYITVPDTGSFTSTMADGTVTISGSTSVFPVMERLIQAYEDINPNARIDLQGGGSSAGMRDAIGDVSDIGMASRDLSDEEMAELNHQAICIDGIAMVVNLDNPITGITSENVTGVFIGELARWSEIQ